MWYHPKPDHSLKPALEELSRRDADIARAFAVCGLPATRNRKPGFPGLVRIIVGQRECRPDDRVAGKLHLVIRPEDAQPHVGSGRLGGLDEGALGKLRFLRHRPR